MKNLCYAAFLLSILIIPPVFATPTTSIELSPMGGYLVDLNSPEYQRFMWIFAEFEHFNLEDGKFIAKIIHSSSRMEIEDYEIKVSSTQTDYANFSSVVAHVFTDNDLREKDIITGLYEIEVSTIDGEISESVSFYVIDSTNWSFTK